MMLDALLQKRRDQALGKALVKGDSAALAKALRAGANPDVQCGTPPRAALWSALVDGHARCLTLLLDAGATRASHAPEGPAALVIAAEHPDQSLALISALLAAGFNPNIDRGAAFFAALSRDDNLALLLINRLMQYGGDLNCQDVNGQSPLALALGAERQLLVGALISSGAPLPDNLDRLPCSEELKTFARRKYQDLEIQRQLQAR